MVTVGMDIGLEGSRVGSHGGLHPSVDSEVGTFPGGRAVAGRQVLPQAVPAISDDVDAGEEGAAITGVVGHLMAGSLQQREGDKGREQEEEEGGASCDVEGQGGCKGTPSYLRLALYVGFCICHVICQAWPT